jgi:nitrite reductase (NADH) large subunit
MFMKKYLIIGNGVAGTTAADAIRQRDATGIITMVTEEKYPFYSRIRLHEYMAGEIDEGKLILYKDQWYRDRAIELKLNTRIVEGDGRGKTVRTGNNETLSYDFLLLATGSRSFVPPIAGAEKKGVFTLRSLQDARSIVEYSRQARRAVLIGGGLLGLESGNALRKRGLKPAVVEFFPRLLPRQLDEEGAKRLQTIMEEMGFSFYLGAKTKEIVGDGSVKGVMLEGGEFIEADLVIVSAGVRPNLELSRSLGLEADKGIKVDERMRTNQPDIYAAGDVVEFKGFLYGIWPAAQEQGKIAGANMAGGNESYSGTTMANILKVAGVDLASAGEIDVENKFESKVIRRENIYQKIVTKDGKIIGCIMLGEISKFNRITRLMAEKQDVSTMLDSILA